LQFVLGVLSLQQSREEEEFRGYVRIVKKKKKTKLAWKLNVVVVAVANFDECVCGNCKINCFKFENH
jgi:hypothetical protein